ncbi:MAG: voltage-gated potassium channel [Alphaproteobacteria bacterium]|jgi:voltage-gated potassium channel
MRSLYDNTVKHQLIRLGILLAILILSHIAAMVYFEGLPIDDAVWLTLTTVTTVGYGDISATTVIGRIFSVILMYVAGIAVLAQVAALYFEFRQNRKHKILTGNWSWQMEDHIVFLNCPKENPEQYFYQSISQLRQSGHAIGQKPVLIVGSNFTHGISDNLRALDVAHVNNVVTHKTTFKDCSLAQAAVIVVLCTDSNDILSDSLNFDIVSRAREHNPNALIIAEVVLDDNRKRLQKAGANHVVRPIRTYPELLVRTIIAPGSEQIIENLFNSTNEQCVKYTVSIKGKWRDIAHAFIANDIGTPLAYANHHEKVIANTHPLHEVDCCAIYVVVREGNIKSEQEIQKYIAHTFK